MNEPADTGELNVYWGETHDNTYQYPEQDPPLEQVVGACSRYLDFYAAAYYTSCSEGFEAGGHPFERQAQRRLILEHWKPDERLDEEWSEVQRVTRALNRPGSFVTFPGYEWQGDGSWGDHNVYHRTERGSIVRVDDLPSLYDRLQAGRAFAIPHHTAYRPGVRGRDWSAFDPELSPFSEIYSVHGCSETDEEWIGLRRNHHMGPGVGPGTWQSALDRGLHLGAVCSNDSWGAMAGRYGDGLAACLAPELTRQALWDAFRRRRVYGVTGDRIRLDFTVDGRPMGSRLRADGPRLIEVDVAGSDAVDRIELLRNGRVIATHCHQGTWPRPECGTRTCWKLRVECGWGPTADELPVGERRWSGKLELSEGRFIQEEPSWITAQAERPRLRGRRAEFSLRTSQDSVGHRWQNANVFEFEAPPEAGLNIELNGLSETGTVAEFAAGSREMWFREQCVRMLHETAGLEPGAPERDDIYHHLAYKAKIHRAVPRSGYTARLEVRDEERLEGETNYRVRIEQRNGQRAWSSPIWVKPAV